MLSTDDLTAMRATLDASLPDTCTVYRLTRTSDGAGGYTEAWNATGSAVACRISPVSSGYEREVAGKLAAVAAWVVTLPQGTDVTAQDKVVAGSRTFQVLAVLAVRSWEISRRVIVQEVL